MQTQSDSKKPSIKILLIEDNAADVRLLRETLDEVQEIVFDMECFSRLSVGVDRLVQGGIDIVLLDLSLPDSQGLETLASVYRQARKVPIIVLTGLDDQRFALEAVRNGAQDYLVKGQMSGKALSKIIHYAIERKRLEADHNLKPSGSSKAANEGKLMERLLECGLLPWLEKAVELNASDIFISVGEPPLVKVYGVFKRLSEEKMTPERLAGIINAILPDQKRWQFLEGREVDFGLDVEKLSRFRANIFREHHGDAVIFRPISRKIPSLAELGLPAVITELTKLTRGLILVTGPTGNGKTTSLAAFLDTINHRDERHIITIEDPIEFVIPHKRSLIHQREVELHTRSFADGLRSAFRENPDVLMIGELRDLESISLAIRAAETGHLVLGTLHSGSAIQSITRIIDVFEGGAKEQIQMQLAQSLQAIVSQKLFKKHNGEGMVLATEVLVATPAIRNIIRLNNLTQLQSYIETGARDGMQTMKQSIQDLIKKGSLDQSALFEMGHDHDGGISDTSRKH